MALIELALNPHRDEIDHPDCNHIKTERPRNSLQARIKPNAFIGDLLIGAPDDQLQSDRGNQTERNNH